MEGEERGEWEGDSERIGGKRERERDGGIDRKVGEKGVEEM